MGTEFRKCPNNQTGTFGERASVATAFRVLGLGVLRFRLWGSGFRR